LLYDYIAAVGGVIFNTDVDNKQLVTLYANAKQKYVVSFEEQKKNAADAVIKQKRKYCITRQIWRWMRSTVSWCR
jgi:maltose-binding protein MalE